MENLLIVAKQVAILFVLMGVGFACRKTKILDDASSRGVIDLLIIVVTPCVIMDAFQRPFDPAMMKGLGIAFVAALIAHVVLIALARTCVRHWADSTRRVLWLSAVFSNAGFIGIPLEQAILGDRGVFYGIAYIVVFNLFMWSWGYSTMKGSVPGEKFSWKTRRTMLVNPGTIGLSVGLLIFLMPWRIPSVIGEPLRFMSGLNTPVAMIAIGYYLAGARLGPVLRMRAAHLATVIRLVVCPLLMLAALYPFRHALDRDMMLALVIAASAPVAAMVSMFAAKFDRDVDASVGLVSGTTLLSILTIPPVVAFAMSVL